MVFNKGGSKIHGIAGIFWCSNVNNLKLPLIQKLKNKVLHLFIFLFSTVP